MTGKSNVSDEATSMMPSASQRVRTLAVRRGTVDDLDNLMIIWKYGQVAQGDVPSEIDQVSDVFRVRLTSQSDAYGIWIAELEGTVVGWQSLHCCRANPIHNWAESSTYISKQYHGRGVGRELLKLATSHAKSVKLAYVTGFIKAGNTASIRIVESLGWKRVGALPRSDPHDSEWLYYVYAVPRD
jgi:phosphinothricin acetyltransferase